MVMSWIWTGILLVSLLFSILTGRGAQLSSAVSEGAQAGITLCITIAGSICLWSGIGNLMAKTGLMEGISSLLRPILGKVFPSTKKDITLRHHVSANVCANFLGLGNAATPMGIQAVKGMVNPKHPKMATNEMCRFVVLNTASIQFIPATVAAIRSSLGANAPFDILPAVWITSLFSAGLGLTMAWLLGKVWKHD